MIDLEIEQYVDSDQSSEHECVVYWIRNEAMSNYINQGYIGVTKNLKQRLGQHESACRCDTYTYHCDMKNAILSNDYFVDILYKGSRDDCFSIENMLRPKKNIGWNQRHGGGKLFVSFDPKIMKIFRNMKHQAKNKGLTVYPVWENTLGYFDFERFYIHGCRNGSLEMKLPSYGEVNKSSLTFVTRKEIVALNNRNIDFFGDGLMMSNDELSKLLCIDKPNTLTTQRKRGWSNGKIFIKAWENDKNRKTSGRKL